MPLSAAPGSVTPTSVKSPPFTLCWTRAKQMPLGSLAVQAMLTVTGRVLVSARGVTITGEGLTVKLGGFFSEGCWVCSLYYRFALISPDCAGGPRPARAKS